MSQSQQFLNIDISVKSPFHTQACLQVGKRTWDTPKHEEEVGRGPHEIRMFGRIVGAQSAEQSVILLLTPKPNINMLCDLIKKIKMKVKLWQLMLQLTDRPVPVRAR